MTALIHIAGLDVTIGERLLRQRCAWCGATLLDYDLTRVAVPVGQDPRPAIWQLGELIAVDGNGTYSVPHEAGAELPAGSCGLIDPDVTR